MDDIYRLFHDTKKEGMDDMTLTQLKYAICAAGEHSMNDAAKKLYISQPSLSGAVASLEKELAIQIFRKSKAGISLTAEGEEFIGYARQVLEQYELLEAKYVTQKEMKQKFSVSLQHYTFAVQAFIETIKQYGMNDYEFEIYEEKTHRVIENVRNCKSEFVKRFLERSLFYGLSSLLDSEMICIFPYFCPYAESAREIREFFI